ncbi:MIP/aquaporin family protein [Arthrobacter celericrescens]|uniref:MIP/aquaporin family protein n=1 Tax=Arthrobacter celericrescens TaxID=2320851 RepID=UPI000EA0AB68|nr:aquaporin [Arthrobacter celericrescens]
MTSTVSAFRPGNSRLLTRAAAEALGTLLVVLIALGAPLFALPQSNPLPAPLAGGLAVTAAMLAFGAFSGGQFNPAITLGNMVAGRTRFAEGLAYLAAQVIGGILGAFLLLAVIRTIPSISDSRAAFDTVASGFGEHSVIQAHMASALLLEVVGAAVLMAVYLGAMSKDETGSKDEAGERKGPALAAPLAVGLTVAVLLQLGQAVGNLAFNPARATAAALFSSGWAAGGLWLFWVAPLFGAAIAGLVFRGFALFSAPAGAAGAPDVDAAAAAEGMDSDAGAASDTAASDKSASDKSASDGGAVPGTAAAAPAAPAERDEARDFFDGKRD